MIKRQVRIINSILRKKTGNKMIHRIFIRREKKNLGHIMTGCIVRKAVGTALKEEKVANGCIVNVLLTDGDGIREINRAFREVDRETDVLSFPQNELNPGAFNPDLCEKDPESGRILLGDMVISIPKCESQGKELGHGYCREIMYLSVHSVLHLLGYDHVDDGEMKRQMRAREKEIMGDD